MAKRLRASRWAWCTGCKIKPTPFPNFEAMNAWVYDHTASEQHLTRQKRRRSR